MIRVRVTLTGLVINGGGISTCYFDTATTTAAAAVDTTADFWDAISPSIDNAITWATEPDVDELSEVTGALVGSSTVTPRTGAGGNIAEALPWATQGLLRCRTGAIVGGRELRGRLFIPGLCENQTTTGRPDLAALAPLNTAAAAMVSRPDAEWVIWSRTHGAMRPVTNATMWSEFAVLRSRRD